MMKKMLALLAVLMLLVGTACADTLVQVNKELEGHETEYHRYDDSYEQPCEQQGKLVKLKYVIDDLYEKPYKHYVRVYLPYGYDENGTERYPVIYFMHGDKCNQEKLLGDETAVNAIDNMIAHGDMPPCIIVAPTYYYDQRNKLMDEDKFVIELRRNIIPLVESTYRTYAETTDEAGLIASRDKRMICGYSHGSGVTWFLMDKMVDYARYFMPCSGTSYDTAKKTLDTVFAGEYGNDMYVYIACGGPEDIAYNGAVDAAKKLITDERLSFGTDFASNNFYFLTSDNPHNDTYIRFFFYNIFRAGLFRD